MIKTTYSKALFGLLVLSLPTALIAQPAGVAPPPAGAVAVEARKSSGDQDYVLGPGDVIEVAALGQPDFTTRARLNSDGTILLPYLGVIPASARSPGQLAEEVRQALERGGFFAQPLIKVDVITASSRSVTVLGAVASPGLVSLDHDYRLSEIMAKVGGRTSGGADYVILTRQDGTTSRYQIDELASGGRDKDPVVGAKDKVYVPATESEIFYLTGAIKSAGSFPLTGDMTVRMALARGGGVSEMGSDKKVKIVRRGVALRDVKLDETQIEPGDVITVGTRLF